MIKTNQNERQNESHGEEKGDGVGQSSREKGYMEMCSSHPSLLSDNMIFFLPLEVLFIPLANPEFSWLGLSGEGGGRGPGCW